MSVFAMPSLPPDHRRRQRRWRSAASGFTYGNSVIHSQTLNSRGLPSRIRVNQRIDYIHLGGKLVAQRSRPISSTTATTTYHHTDSIQSANVETNTAGTQTQRTVRMSCGSPYNGVYREGPGFAGHVTDTQTNLTYMQQRYYVPVALRFLSPDPVDVSPTTGSNFNRYWYANNNPYRYVDPDGREAGFTYHRDGRMTNYLTENEPHWATAGALTISVIPIIGDAVAIGEAIANPTAANIMAAAVHLSFAVVASRQINHLDPPPAPIAASQVLVGTCQRRLSPAAMRVQATMAVTGISSIRGTRVRESTRA